MSLSTECAAAFLSLRYPSLQIIIFWVTYQNFLTYSGERVQQASISAFAKAMLDPPRTANKKVTMSASKPRFDTMVLFDVATLDSISDDKLQFQGRNNTTTKLFYGPNKLENY